MAPTKLAVSLKHAHPGALLLLLGSQSMPQWPGPGAGSGRTLHVRLQPPSLHEFPPHGVKPSPSQHLTHQSVSHKGCVTA